MARETKNILVNLIMERHLRELAAKHLHGRLIDIGCGTKPYHEMLASVIDEHVGVDQAGSPHGTSNVDIIGTAYNIPVPDESFDCALCTAVLEHLEEPRTALRECFRVLRPGGIAVYSVPFIWHLHEEPRDFYRYSKHGLKYLIEQGGFELVEINALSGFWVTFGQLFVYYLYRFQRGPMRYLPLIPALGLFVQGVAWLGDRLDKAEEWTWMYMVVARKPATLPATPDA